MAELLTIIVLGSFVFLLIYLSAKVGRRDYEEESIEIEYEDLGAVSRRAKKYGFARWILLFLSVIAFAYFLQIRITEGYPIDWKAILVPFGGFIFCSFKSYALNQDAMRIQARMQRRSKVKMVHQDVHFPR